MQRFRFGSTSFTAPESWHEITLGQFLALASPDRPDTPSFVLSTLTGITEEELKQMSGPFNLSKFINQHLSYLDEVPDAGQLLPDVLTVGGKQVSLPEDLGTVATLGQMWDIELLVKEYQQNRVPLTAVTVAEDILPVFLWPLFRTEPYQNRYQAAELWPLLSSMNCIHGLAASAFFLINSSEPFNSGEISVEKLNRIPTNFWQRKVHPILKRLIRSTPVSS